MTHSVSSRTHPRPQLSRLPFQTGSAWRFGSRKVQVLPDGQVIAVSDQHGTRSSATIVQRLVEQNGQYLIDETVDIAISAVSDAAPSPLPPATPAIAPA